MEGMDQGSLSLVSALLLFACPAARGSSASEEGKLLFTIFSTDDPSLPELVAELRAEDRTVVYFDSTLPTAQILVSGLEEYQQFFDEILRKNRDRTIASQRRLMDEVAALTNNSPYPNEIAELFLYSEKAVAFGETNILTCFVSGFFPPAITVTLQKNEEPLFSEVNSSRLLFGEDWHFQVLLYTEIQPAAGDIYSCKVVHTISKEQRIIYWEPEVPDSSEGNAEQDSSQLAILVCGLIVGILGTAAGLCLCCWAKRVNRVTQIIQMNSRRRSSDSA
ncbi:rano class II histocompatibility antigen, B alpha chain-like [Heptranchias perlo]|uniref:rano class II histocompatibility antigen, B alpha chain-like n=1 Tax=Heptranchias perlo TaxID=212740 RepID=UPI00355A24C3